jgi:hypothetical protein
MKKKIMGFLLMLAGGFCFAQTSNGYIIVNHLIKFGLNKNFARIQQVASDLSENERLMLYEAHSIGTEKMWAGAAIDFFIGFGIGNFYQGDYLSGGIALGGDIIGFGLGITGAYLATIGYAVSLISLFQSEETIQLLENGLYFLASGITVFLASRIFGLVRTFVFPSAYNNKLRNALNVGGLVLNIEPSLDITERGYELALVRFRF